MDEYVCVRLRSRPGETKADFSKRLIDFWSHFLRTRPDEYEQVYAETTRFERDGDYFVRQYLVGLGVLGFLEKELQTGGIQHDPIDHDELYTKYEAVAPEWFQIPH